jgi:hypothetical protein
MTRESTIVKKWMGLTLRLLVALGRCLPLLREPTSA